MTLGKFIDDFVSAAEPNRFTVDRIEVEYDHGCIGFTLTSLDNPELHRSERVALVDIDRAAFDVAGLIAKRVGHAFARFVAAT